MISLCVSRVGGGRVHQSPGVHFSLDSGSSSFRASLGQLGTDQKPQAEEKQACRVSANRGRDPPLRARSLGARSPASTLLRQAGEKYRLVTSSHRGQHYLLPA